MKKLKLLLQIWIFLIFMFWGLKIFFYLDKVPEYKWIINKQLSWINSIVNNTKPQVKKINKNISVILLKVEKLSVNLLSFWKILDNTLSSLDYFLVNLNEFDKSLNSIKPILNYINNKLSFANNKLLIISPELKDITDITTSINNKLNILEHISIKERQLLEELMRLNISTLNKEIKKQIWKHKQIENSIRDAKQMMNKVKNIIPQKDQVKESDKMSEDLMLWF